MTKTLLAAIIAVYSSLTLAWDGYDYEEGSYVEIESGNLVRPGKEIEIYDYGDGEYHNVEVQTINRFGNTVEVEVYDYETGEIRFLEMDAD